MSASLRAPWIHDYLLQVAEEDGANLNSVALESKGRRAQLVQVSLLVNVQSITAHHTV